jgi:hypothetical protein
MEPEPLDLIDPDDSVRDRRLSKTVHRDRRRPGRDPDLRPELISLLRGTVRTGIGLIVEFVRESDPLATARGVMWGLLLWAAIWVPVAFTVWLLD